MEEINVCQETKEVVENIADEVVEVTNSLPKPNVLGGIAIGVGIVAAVGSTCYVLYKGGKKFVKFVGKKHAEKKKSKSIEVKVDEVTESDANKTESASDEQK